MNIKEEGVVVMKKIIKKNFEDIGFAGCFEFRVRDEWFDKTPSEIYKQIVDESRIRDLREIEQEKERLMREASRLGMMLVDIPMVDVMEELNG
jgi:hypothetical protein